MNCMRCGKDTSFENVFCDECLKEMAKHPVNPNTPVILPKRKASSVKKTNRRKTVSADEQIAGLKHRIHVLSVVLVAVSILAALLVYPAVKYLMEDHVLPGQNYTSIVSKSSSPDPTESN